MAGIKISALPAVASAMTTDIFPVVQAGTTSQESLAQVQTLFGFTGGILGLAYGGTNAALTASNGGIFYSTATAGAILSGTATANQVLLSGASGAPSWSTAAYLQTILSGSIVYGGSLNVMSGLAIGSTGQFLTVSGGFPAWSTATLPATATSTGTILRANGTNWVASTSTFADTYAINTLLYASGSNAVTGLATVTTAVLTTSSGVPTWASQLSLALGGTNAGLTASNGGIVYSGASALAILSGTATAGLALLSGASGAPTWSTKAPITQVKVTVVSSTNASWTPTTGMVELTAEGVGGGGGGAGVPSTAGGQQASGAGGGYGGYFKKTWTAANVGASLNITIGAAGAAGSAGQNAGGNGGNTSIVPAGTGSTLTANGGTGGPTQGVQSPGAGGVSMGVVGGAGGTASNGDINIQGANGYQGWAAVTGGVSIGGNGGNGIWGSGGQAAINSAGGAATGNGAGGAGAAISASDASAKAGGPGTIGLVVITEYISV